MPRPFRIPLLVPVLVALACRNGAPPPTTLEARDAETLRLLRAEFRRRADSAPPRVIREFRPAAIDFSTQQSAAVPGLTYWWGSYVFDYGVVPNLGTSIPAARTATSARLLRTPDDWFAAARSAGWRPQGPANVLAGCIEAATTTSRRSVGPNLAFAYRDSFQLRHASKFPQLMVEQLVQSRRFTDSQARGNASNGFVADFWMFELGRATRYRCTLRSDGFQLTATDSIEGGGFPLPS